MNSWWQRIAVLATLGLLGVGCTPAVPSAPQPTATPPAAKTNLKMALTGLSPSSWPLFVGERRGFYSAAGLNVEHVVINSSVTQVQALVAGDVQSQTNSVDAVAKAVAQGAPLRYVATAQATPNFRVVVANDITSWSDLKGKTVAAGNPGGFFNVMLSEMMAANGLNEGEYTVLTITNSADRLPALQAGKISGMIVGGPDDAKAINMGFKSLGYVADYVKDVEYNGYAFETKWATTNPQSVVAFLKATHRAVDWLFDPANKAEAITIYGDVTNLDAESVQSIYAQLITQQMLSRDMRPNRPAIEKLLTFEQQSGLLAVVPAFETWIDESYLSQALAG
jgi:ABC-type nitrate/sulfonate/bicarbonate transport system substrate-binding protein